MTVRVAVTGLGVKVPGGSTVDEAFAGVMRAQCLARRLPDGPGGQPVLACVVDDPLQDYFDRRELNGLDRTAQLGVAAALDAYHDSGLDPSASSLRWSVHAGTSGMGLAATAEQGTEAFWRQGVTPGAFTVPRLMPSATAARTCLKLGLKANAVTYATACASGATAIGEALRVIRGGYADVALAGGADAGLTPLVVESFRRVGALSSRFDDPGAASRPFDADRDGFVIAEGAAFLLLERLEHAQARGARIYAELAGYGANSDAFHVVAPRPDGEVAADCMAAALGDAGIAPAEVGHVNAHGTSTTRNDEAEARAIIACFGAHTPAVTAPKGVTGHMIGAAGAFEAVVTVLSVGRGVVPPVANHASQATGPKVDVVHSEPRRVTPAPAISNSFAFGGHNVALVFRPADGGGAR